LQGGQVGFQIFAGTTVPSAGRQTGSCGGACEIKHSFQIAINHLMFNAVCFQAGRQSGNSRRRFRGFRDGRMN
jgi:hypothetical protein